MVWFFAVEIKGSPLAEKQQAFIKDSRTVEKNSTWDVFSKHTVPLCLRTAAWDSNDIAVGKFS